jgi:phosphate transport system protein
MPVRTPHVDPHYEADLRALEHHLARAGLRAVGMVRGALRALVERDMGLARSVVGHDRELDRLESETDELCLGMLARHSPVGGDLRFVTSALKADVDLERIGDLAVNIAHRTLEMGMRPGLEPIPEIVALGDGAVGLVDRAVRALLDRDATSAMEIKLEDPLLDGLNRSVFDRMLEIARRDRDELDRALAYTSIARHFERIADHAVNIAEHAVFVADGRMLRHTDPSGMHHDAP